VRLSGAGVIVIGRSPEVLLSRGCSVEGVDAARANAHIEGVRAARRRAYRLWRCHTCSEGKRWAQSADTVLPVPVTDSGAWISV